MADMMTRERITTVQVSRETWRRLNSLRNDPLETMDQVIQRLLMRESAKAKPAD